MKSDLFKVRCGVCDRILDLKENRFILVFEDRHNDNRAVYHKRATNKHFCLKCAERLKIL